MFEPCPHPKVIPIYVGFYQEFFHVNVRKTSRILPCVITHKIRTKAHFFFLQMRASTQAVYCTCLGLGGMQCGTREYIIGLYAV